jgi:hypothetical protein
MEQMVTWGAQTVGNAMIVKSLNIGRPIKINCTEDAEAQSNKISSISQELWDASVNECKPPAKIDEVYGKFAVKIFDWAKKHIDE